VTRGKLGISLREYSTRLVIPQNPVYKGLSGWSFSLALQGPLEVIFGALCGSAEVLLQEVKARNLRGSATPLDVVLQFPGLGLWGRSLREARAIYTGTCTSKV
jgi:hypothetical protein